MVSTLRRVIAVVTITTALNAIPAGVMAQTADVKEKPRMYTYDSSWVYPRAKWGDVDKDNAQGNQKILAPALSDGTLLGYGDDENLVHTADGPTHDNWFQATSMAGLMKVLDAFYKTGSATNSVTTSSTKHWDAILVSRFYNWKAGSWKGAYGRSATYKLRADAPPDAVATLSKTAFVPILEKLLADGAIVEYEIDEETIHTQDPDSFYVYILAPTADGLDKLNDAIREFGSKNPLFSPAFNSLVDFTPHRDQLWRANATYK
jgi:hypothetical protein